MGSIQKRIYLVEHPQGLDPLRNVRGLLRTQAATSIIPTQDTGLGGIIGSPNPRYVIAKSWLQTPSQFLPKGYLESHNDNWKTKQRCMESRSTGFSSSSSSDRLTEEQENEIAENIYDWWISGKSYKQWYAEKFQQLKLDFGEF